jgi:predicted lipoprotein with Yx(FWY)xxD motif
MCLESGCLRPPQKNSALALNIPVTYGVIPVRNQEPAGGAIMASKISTAARDGRAGDCQRKGIGGLGIRTVLPGLALAAAAGLLAACGSAGTHAAGGGEASSAGASHRVVVSARKLPGIGNVLVSRFGKTIYSPQQEAHGKILCTGSCLTFWFPVPAGAGAARHAPDVIGALGTIRRPDGRTQLTYNGKPLYTFRLDLAPGQAHGNNFTDHFGGTSFTWHAITTGGSTAGTGQQGNGGGYAYPGGSPGY